MNYTWLIPDWRLSLHGCFVFLPFRSFASVNIPIVAVWLSGLTGEERERFQMLRRKFSEIQVRKACARFCCSVWPVRRFSAHHCISGGLLRVRVSEYSFSRTPQDYIFLGPRLHIFSLHHTETTYERVPERRIGVSPIVTRLFFPVPRSPGSYAV